MQKMQEILDKNERKTKGKWLNVLHIQDGLIIILYPYDKKGPLNIFCIWDLVKLNLIYFPSYQKIINTSEVMKSDTKIII